MPPRPAFIPDPVATEPAPNGPEPFLDDRKAAAAWAKANPDAFAVLQREIARENPHSEAAGGRKAFLSALLLGRIGRILRGHEKPPGLAGEAETDPEAGRDGPPSEQAVVKAHSPEEAAR